MFSALFSKIHDKSSKRLFFVLESLFKTLFMELDVVCLTNSYIDSHILLENPINMEKIYMLYVNDCSSSERKILKRSSITDVIYIIV